MKKVVTIFIAAIMLFSSKVCFADTDKTKDKEEFNLVSTNISKFIKQHGLSFYFISEGKYVEDDENIYYVSGDTIKKFNKKTSEDTLIADSKLHDVTQIVLNDNKIYFVDKNDRGCAVYKYDLKTAERTTVKEFKFNSLSIVINEGTMYYAANSINNSTSEIGKYNLNTKNDENIYTEKHQYNCTKTSNITLIDNSLYYHLSKELLCQDGAICKIDLKTNKRTLLYTSDYSTSPKNERALIKVKDRIFFITRNDKLMSVNENGGQAKVVIEDRVKDVVIFKDEAYIINADDKSRLYKIKLDGSKVEAIDKDGSKIKRNGLVLFKRGLCIINWLDDPQFINISEL